MHLKVQDAALNISIIIEQHKRGKMEVEMEDNRE